MLRSAWSFEFWTASQGGVDDAVQSKCSRCFLQMEDANIELLQKKVR